jgi:hypothetical protein
VDTGDDVQSSAKVKSPAHSKAGPLASKAAAYEVKGGTHNRHESDVFSESGDDEDTRFLKEGEDRSLPPMVRMMQRWQGLQVQTAGLPVSAESKPMSPSLKLAEFVPSTLPQSIKDELNTYIERRRRRLAKGLADHGDGEGGVVSEQVRAE